MTPNSLSILPAAPLSSIMASSRCSTETYSSLSFLASSSAWPSSAIEPAGDADVARCRR